MVCLLILLILSFTDIGEWNKTYYLSANQKNALTLLQSNLVLTAILKMDNQQGPTL